METRLKLIEIALKEYGNIELDGPNSNPDVMKYFHETGREWVEDDSTPWCDAFVDWVVMKAGGDPSPGLLARAWLDFGEVILEPEVGDLVIFWRVKWNSPYGHVGFFVRRKDNYIWVLGGNQSNMVKIAVYSAERVLGYRRIEIE